MTVRGLWLVGLGAFATGIGASAHHSFTTTYDETMEIQIEGMLIRRSSAAHA